MKLDIAVIPGDGIGPEIVREARKVLDTVAERFGHELAYTELLMGGASIDVHGVPLTDELHRRRCGDLTLVSASARKETGGRTFEAAQVPGAVCQPKTGRAL